MFNYDADVKKERPRVTNVKTPRHDASKARFRILHPERSGEGDLPQGVRFVRRTQRVMFAAHYVHQMGS